jgi:hypothetical protein
MQDDQGNLLRLSHRILDEEIKLMNQALRAVCSVQLIYAKDKTVLVREYSRNRKKIIRLAEYITGKKLSEINFEENQIDQLKVRIILRKYFGKIIFKIAFQRFLDLIHLIKNFSAFTK